MPQVSLKPATLSVLLRFRIVANPPRIETKCGDHFRQADLSLLIVGGTPPFAKNGYGTERIGSKKDNLRGED